MRYRHSVTCYRRVTTVCQLGFAVIQSLAAGSGAAGSGAAGSGAAVLVLLVLVLLLALLLLLLVVPPLGVLGLLSRTDQSVMFCGDLNADKSKCDLLHCVRTMSYF